MKAAVIDQRRGMPQYREDVSEPTVQNNNELLITVKASAIKHLDKSRVSGKHYSAEGNITAPQVIGGDGVGTLPNGTRVFALGDGMMAEKALIKKDRMIKLPDQIDDATAAALPNAVAGSAMALRFRAGIKKGETVLINGATGFTGKIAVQVAKYYGAKNIIVTGRNEETLQALRALGADQTVSLKQNEADFIAQIKAINQHAPVDIIVDYLWGRTAELILDAFKGQGSFTHKTRFVSVGSVTGDKIQLSAEVLRSVDLQLTGSGLGSWTKGEMKKLFRSILPDMFRLAAGNKLKVDTLCVDLKDIEKLWEMDVPDGKRLVVTIR